jgi:ribosomal protein S1
MDYPCDEKSSMAISAGALGEPDMTVPESWDRFKQSHPAGDVIEGRVSRHVIYGFYVDLGQPFDGLVDIINVRDNPPINGMADFPQVGQLIRAVVLGYTDRDFQVALGTRASDFPRDGNLN